MKNENNQGTITVRIKPYTVKTLASFYEVDRRTFNTWLNEFRQELGKRVGKYYTIPQVVIIFKRLKLPCNVVVENIHLY